MQAHSRDVRSTRSSITESKFQSSSVQDVEFTIMYFSVQYLCKFSYFWQSTWLWDDYVSNSTLWQHPGRWLQDSPLSLASLWLQPPHIGGARGFFQIWVTLQILPCQHLLNCSWWKKAGWSCIGQTLMIWWYLTYHRKCRVLDQDDWYTCVWIMP